MRAPEEQYDAPSAATETMWVDTTVLYAAAHRWEWTVADQLYTAAHAVAEGADLGRLFGRVFAPAGEAHDSFARTAMTQLRAGAAVAEQIGGAVRTTLDEWVRTDEGAAEAHDRLRRLA